MYGWMSATASYRTSRMVCAIISTVSNVFLIDGYYFPTILVIRHMQLYLRLGVQLGFRTN
jgi:hypothetical protein